MMRQSLILVICLFGCIHGFLNPYKTLINTRENIEYRADGDPGEPLFLTPYLEQGKIEEARNLR